MHYRTGKGELAEREEGFPKGVIPLPQSPPDSEPPTSSKTRFLALVMAELRALIQDSFSSGLTARKIRLGAYEGKSLVSPKF